MANTPVPQRKFTDDQNVATIDIDEMFANFITPIDQIRNHVNILGQTPPTQLGSINYQESRCSAFYRMIGFPVTSLNANGFYSPGFDPNLNTDSSAASVNKTIADKVIADTAFIQQLNTREAIYRGSNRIFNSGGINAIATTLGSIYIRNFSNQFNNTIGPLDNDPSQVQTLSARNDAITKFINDSKIAADIAAFNPELLPSEHILKPFVVDPRVDSNMKPAANRICAPFLLDRTQTKIFNAGAGAAASIPLKRPYIERVISVRFNNNDVITDSATSIATMTEIIKNDINVIDPDLVAAFNAPLNALYSSELVAFNQYFRIMRALIGLLYDSINAVENVRAEINFRPIPNQAGGIESGGKLDVIIPGDGNNWEKEHNYLSQSIAQISQELSFDVGLQGIPDTGDFVFSNLDDTVFEAFKSVPKSYQETIDKLTIKRNDFGNTGLSALKTIEIIVGEFSGLGIIDIVAVQAALWIMPPASLLGLIDSNARDRIINRPNIDTSAVVAPNNILTSLTDFEKTLKNIYILIQKYYDDLVHGVLFTAS
jgi:hypothetical protein